MKSAAVWLASGEVRTSLKVERKRRPPFSHAASYRARRVASSTSSALSGAFSQGWGARSRAGLGADGGVVGLDGALFLGGERGVAGGDAVIGRALEHGEVFGGGGDDRDRLDAGRAGADLADALAGEVDAVMGPEPGVVGGAGEGVDAGDAGHVGGREAADGGDEEAGVETLAGGGLDDPAVAAAVEAGGGDAGAELDVAAEVEAVDDVFEVAQDFGLGGVALGPLPFLLEFGREAVGVVEALGIAAGAGVAVPIPRAAHAIGGLEHADVEAEFVAQDMQLIEPGEPGSNDHRIQLGRYVRRNWAGTDTDVHARSSVHFRRRLRARAAVSRGD